MCAYKHYDIEQLGPLVAMGEILRRMVWGFFRLEHEQLEVIGSPIVNTGTFLIKYIILCTQTINQSNKLTLTCI
jgi:hypothetical protein